MARPPQRADCVVVGGGPAGIVLSLLLARAGVRVTVLEKHPDFLRDFRGDTVHPSTLTLLDELGLGERFDRVPHRDFKILSFPLDGTLTPFADFDQLRGPHNHIRMVPQWDFLNLLAEEAATEPTFHLAMSTEVTGLLREQGRVTGVRYRSASGVTGEIQAPLTVACDGRQSLVRKESGLPLKEMPVPMDAWWFGIPRNHEEDIEGAVGQFRPGHLFVLVDRGDNWQIMYLLKKGSDARRRAEDIERFRQVVAAELPWMADRVGTISSWDDVKFLDVRVNRLPKWYDDGVLCIGDAAHAMSSVGGVGVNLAVQDGVAAGRLLAPALRRGRVTTKDLARVQARRMFPTVVVQFMQKMLHANIFEPVLSATGSDSFKTPPIAKLLVKHPKLRRIPAYMIGIGPRPEHAPEYARRPTPVG